MTSLRNWTSLPKDFETGNNAVSTNKNVASRNCWTRVVRLTRNGISTALGSIYKLYLLDVQHLNGYARNIIAGDIIEIEHWKISKWRFSWNRSDVELKIVKSRYNSGGTNGYLEDYDETCNALQNRYRWLFFRVFAHGSNEPTAVERFGRDQLENPEKQHWFAKTLLPFHLEMTENEIESVEYGLVPYFETTPSLNTVSETINYILLHWATDGEIDHTVDTGITLIDEAETEKWLAEHYSLW